MKKSSFGGEKKKTNLLALFLHPIGGKRLAFRVKRVANTLKINHNCASLKQFVICIVADAFLFCLLIRPSLQPPGRFPRKSASGPTLICPASASTDHPVPGSLRRQFSHDARGLRWLQGQSSEARPPAIGYCVCRKEKKSSLRDRRNGACVCF